MYSACVKCLCNRVCYRACYRVASRHQDIVVYLKSPRRRREKVLLVKRYRKYFSVPKIASPEARKKLIRKCFAKYRCVPKIASPEARKSESTTVLYKVSLCTQNRLAGGAKKANVLRPYRAMGPRIRTLRLVRGECTTALQGHGAKNPGSWPSAGRMYHGPRVPRGQESGLLA